MRPTTIAFLVLATTQSWGCSTDVLIEDTDVAEEDFVPDDDDVDITRSGLQFRPCGNCGKPLADLDEARREAFKDGVEEFEEAEEIDEGLGPVFNDVSCEACHDTPATGGSGTTFVTRFGRGGRDGSFDPLERLGGSLRQDHGIGELRVCGLRAEVTPRRANVEAHRRTTPLFGLGLVEAVPDQTLLDLASAQPRSIRGVAHMVDDVASGERRVGRFGWKSQVATLRTFSGDAYLNEMGITSPDFPKENCPQGNCNILARCDKVADPEDDGEAIDAFTNFMSLMAPPAPGPKSRRARQGERLFEEIGCTGCHVATLETGDSPVPQLNHVKLQPYSDFLLHDMGYLGDGITQGQATGRLMRTAPLWGVSAQPFFLHDGRASTLGRAIRAHEGQGARARARFVRMSLDDRRAVIAFLRSL